MMRKVLLLSAHSVPACCLLFVFSLSLSLEAQTNKSPRTVTVNPAGSHDGRQIHERIYVICPMIGAGTLNDPKRPQVAPIAVEKLSKGNVLNGKAATPPTGIIAWTFQVSDDGKSALVELVARNSAAFIDIKKLNGVTSQVFSHSSHSKDQIESAFKAQRRKDFDFKKFGAVVR